MLASELPNILERIVFIFSKKKELKRFANTSSEVHER